MTPQLVDLNADGHKDMVMATFEGTAFLVEGSPDGWQAPQHIVDKNDSRVRIAMYWDLDEETYLDVDRSTDDYENNKEHHMTSLAMVDWDEDGDLDMVQGAYEGALYLCLNDGSAREPRFAEKNLQVKAGGKHLTIEGGLATPHIVDWNGDGLFDILCGGARGGVYYYQNTGTKGEPVFAAAETLIARTVGARDSSSVAGDSDEAEAVVEDYYTSMMVPAKDGAPACPGTSFHLDTVDYDGDGDLDLLVGAQSYFEQGEKVLSDEEKKELAGLKEKSEAIQEKLMKLYEGKQQEEIKKVIETDEFKKVSEEFGKLFERINELEPSPEAANYIWLYRNNTGKSRTSAPLETRTEPGFDPDEFAVRASFEPETATAGDAVTLTVHVHIPQGYHIYGAKSGTAPTTLSITEDGGLKVDGEAVVPAGRMVVDSGKPAFWLEDIITIQQKMTLPTDFKSATLEGHVSYMMCNEQGCQPPAKEKFSVTFGK